MRGRTTWSRWRRWRGRIGRSETDGGCACRARHKDALCVCACGARRMDARCGVDGSCMHACGGACGGFYRLRYQPFPPIGPNVGASGLPHVVSDCPVLLLVVSVMAAAVAASKEGALCAPRGPPTARADEPTVAAGRHDPTPPLAVGTRHGGTGYHARGGRQGGRVGASLRFAQPPRGVECCVVIVRVESFSRRQYRAKSCLSNPARAHRGVVDGDGDRESSTEGCGQWGVGTLALPRTRRVPQMIRGQIGAPSHSSLSLIHI